LLEKKIRFLDFERSTAAPLLVVVDIASSAASRRSSTNPS